MLKKLLIYFLIINFLFPPLSVFAENNSELKLNSKDPITQEKLNNFTKFLTIAGLASGIGSGKLARTAGTAALEKVAKESGIHLDDILPIAEEVAKKYSVSSLEDLQKLKGKISLEKFVEEVKEAVRKVKGGTNVLVKNIKLSTLADEIVELPFDAWIFNWSKRGQIIDTGLGNNLGSTFKGIDILENRTIISIKSMDISAETYQTAANPRGKLKEYVNKLDKFTDWKEVKVGRYDTKQLKLALPDINISQAQLDVINEMKSYAKSINIDFKITIVT